MAGKKNQGSSEREMIDTGRDKRYVKRDEEGRFKEVEDAGRSLAQDRKRFDSTGGRVTPNDLVKAPKGRSPTFTAAPLRRRCPGDELQSGDK
jgi:hypothetical protein